MNLRAYQMVEVILETGITQAEMPHATLLKVGICETL